MGEAGLKYTIDTMGADRIVYASDFPHEPTEEDLTSDLPNFLADTQYTEDVKRKIARDNAKRLYRIDGNK